VLLDRQCEAICSEVALLLKQERKERGLSLNALAERAGLSRQTVSFVEQELRVPTLATLLRLSLAMGVNLEDIIALARNRAVEKTGKQAGKK
jgi:transcriptional regulator with XRE-family HTH domain